MYYFIRFLHFIVRIHIWPKSNVKVVEAIAGQNDLYMVMPLHQKRGHYHFVNVYNCEIIKYLTQNDKYCVPERNG